MSLEQFPSRRGDRGMTLPELLVSFTMMGLLAAVIGTAVSVVLRQSQDSEGRLNVARSEQSIDTWLPADLASTDVNDVALPAVELDPAATPCGNCGTIDLSGANALQLAWQTTVPGSPPTEVITRVQYQYVEREGAWVMERIQCSGSEPCSVGRILNDLEPPADVAAFNPNTDRPLWVMDVSVPEVDPDLELSGNARQIVVTVDGGGRVEGGGGGSNSISLTAGGRTTSEIAADEFTVPSFVRAKSRCGGNITLIVDESGSVGSAITSTVNPGVEAFIEAFRGTPTNVQVVQFSSKAEPVGNGSDWHNYVDMTDDGAVDTLISQVNSQITPGGGTNWEEAFFRTLRNSDGSVASELPKRVVFFTDGVPTFHRRSERSGWTSDQIRNGDLVDYNAGKYNGSIWPMATGSYWAQEAWDRADVILDMHRDVDLIFVGVGTGLDSTVDWRHNPAAYGNTSAPLGSAPSPAMTGRDALTYLLANAPSGEVEALYNGSEYTNPETANWYDQQNFSRDAFAAAMKAAALKDCGGTLTLQTRLDDGSPVSDEFIYENVEYRDQDGTKVDAEARRVTTSSVFRTGTFDFEFAGADSFDVDIVPQELQTLDDYTPVTTAANPTGWVCRAAGNTKDITPIPITDSSFSGFTIDLSANEAASCILTVSN